jgi:hypothetical protein
MKIYVQVSNACNQLCHSLHIRYNITFIQSDLISHFVLKLDSCYTSDDCEDGAFCNLANGDSGSCDYCLFNTTCEEYTLVTLNGLEECKFYCEG